MTSQLRRRVWVRLGFVSTLVAAFAGGSIFFLERAEMAQRVRELAVEEARTLVEHAEAIALAPEGDRAGVAAVIADHLLRHHVTKGRFAVIELYDASRRKLVEVFDPEYAGTRVAADGADHAHLLGDAQDHERFTVGDASFVRVVTPLRQSDGKLAYFEGVYRIDAEVLRAMRRGLVQSVVLVVLVILAAVAVLYPVIMRLNRDLLRLSGDLAHANMGMLAALGSAVAKRDRGTNAHNYRVTIYAIRLAEEVGLSPERIRGLIKGAFLHDVGKIGIADAILKKPGRLTAEEVAIMRAHVRHGVEIVAKFRWLEDALEVVQHHHEKIDGSGYPAGLKGEQIPTAARVFAIVDVFDALTTRRPYKEPAPLHDAIFTLLAEKGTAFDPELLEAFLALAPELHRTVCGAPEAQLVRMLDRLLVRYFSAEERRTPYLPLGRGRAARRRVGSEGAELDYLSGTWSLDTGSRRDTPWEPSRAERQIARR